MTITPSLTDFAILTNSAVNTDRTASNLFTFYQDPIHRNPKSCRHYMLHRVADQHPTISVRKPIYIIIWLLHSCQHQSNDLRICTEHMIQVGGSSAIQNHEPTSPIAHCGCKNYRIIFLQMAAITLQSMYILNLQSTNRRLPFYTESSSAVICLIELPNLTMIKKNAIINVIL